MADVAVGFASHAGWAIAVTVGVDVGVDGKAGDGQLEIHDRRCVELVSPTLPPQAYHAAVDLGRRTTNMRQPPH